MLFGIHSLACCNGNHLVDVVYRTSAAEVVHRTCDALQNRTYCHCVAKTLYKFVRNVSYLKAWEYEHVCLSCDVAARSFLLSNSRNECCVSLELTVYFQLWCKFFCEFCSLYNLVYYLVLCTSLC